MRSAVVGLEDGYQLTQETQRDLEVPARTN